VTTFYLIRHAEKACDPDLLTGRAVGVALSEEGRRQAERIARRFAGVRLSRVLSSPLQRAQETAEPIARAAGLPVEISAALDEMNFGEWTGRRCAELAGNARWAQFNRFRSGTRIPGGETMLEVQARLVGEMLRLRDAVDGGAVALVSHGDPIRAAVVYFAGAILDAWERFEISPASVTTIVLGAEGVRITGLNDERARRE
jgi:probable phosphoglycerate mutase